MHHVFGSNDGPSGKLKLRSHHTSMEVDPTTLSRAVLNIKGQQSVIVHLVANVKHERDLLSAVRAAAASVTADPARLSAAHDWLRSNSTAFPGVSECPPVDADANGVLRGALYVAAAPEALQDVARHAVDAFVCALATDVARHAVDVFVCALPTDEAPLDHLLCAARNDGDDERPPTTAPLPMATSYLVDALDVDEPSVFRSDGVCPPRNPTPPNPFV